MMAHDRRPVFITLGWPALLLIGQDGADSLNTRDDVRGNDVANGGAGEDSCKTDRGDTRSSC